MKKLKNTFRVGLSIPLPQSLWRRINNSIRYIENTQRFPISEYWENKDNTLRYRYENGVLHVADFHSRKTSILKTIYNSIEKTPKGLVNAGLSLAGWQSRAPDVHRRFSMRRRGRKHLHLLPKALKGTFGELHRIKTANACAEILELTELSDRRILEIGAGPCLLALALFNNRANLSYHIIELPVMLPLAVATVHHFRPDLRLRLPGENLSEEKSDIRWLVPSETDQVQPKVDIAINITSFQEMNYRIINSYFAVIERVLRPGGVFYCVNRKNKFSPDDASIEFHKYPWPDTGYVTLMDGRDLLADFKGPSAPILRRAIQKQSAVHKADGP